MDPSVGNQSFTLVKTNQLNSLDSLNTEREREKSKKCPSCNLIKSLNEFAWNGNDFYWCKPCNAIYQRFYKYGITQEEYIKLLQKQNGNCGICYRSLTQFKKICTDHDHITGKIRGLLCVRCNTALGMFEKDPKLLGQLLEYLK